MKTKLCKMCGKEFPREELSSKGFCARCVIQRFINYHEKALEHYRSLLKEWP